MCCIVTQKSVSAVLVTKISLFMSLTSTVNSIERATVKAGTFYKLGKLSASLISDNSATDFAHPPLY